MGLHVLKFGGTSVGSLKRIEHVAELAVKRQQEGHQVAVVVSAMSGDTDKMLEQARHFTRDPNSRELDILLSTGEQRTIALLSICLQARGVQAQSLWSTQIGVRTNRDHTRARIEGIETKKIAELLAAGKIVILPGFQGLSEDGEITTLGRGGSDTSAVAFAAALKADLCEIFTDVEGVYTTDPNLVPEASKLKKLTYDEMLELASLGAKVLQTRSVEFAKNYKIPLHVRSTFKAVEGTWVVEKLSEMESLVVAGITYTKNEAKVVVEGMPDRVGIAAELFGALADEGVMVDVIVQNVSKDGTTDISFTLVRDDLPRCLDLLKKIQPQIAHQTAKGDPHISKVSVVGNGMRTHSGVAAKVFKCLSDENINVQMISTSEIKISCVVDESRRDDAVKALHKSFGLEKLKVQEVNDFVA